MSNVNLELQLKFLRDLDDALSDALEKHPEETPEKLSELSYMKQEVARARRIVSKRLVDEGHAPSPVKRRGDDTPAPTTVPTSYTYQEAAVS